MLPQYFHNIFTKLSPRNKYQKSNESNKLKSYKINPTSLE